MGRPKASDPNLRAAMAFAEVVISREQFQMSNARDVRIHRRGPSSIFAVFRACLPELARDSREKFPSNRDGVSMVEFNKSMKNAGFRSFRKKVETIHGIKWVRKVLFGTVDCCFSPSVALSPPKR